MIAALMINNLIFFDTVTSYFVLFMLVAYLISRSPYEFVPSRQREGSAQKSIRWTLVLGVLILVFAISVPQIKKAYYGAKEFTLPLDKRASWYQKVEDASPYGSSLFISQRADIAYAHVFEPNLASIMQQNEANKAVAITAIQGLIDALRISMEEYSKNEQGEMVLGKLAGIKMVIQNKIDPVSLGIMKQAAQEAILLAPNNPNAYLLLGQGYVYEQQYDEAFEQFEKARMLEPQVAQPHLSLISLAKLVGDNKKVVLYEKRALQESPYFSINKK